MVQDNSTTPTSDKWGLCVIMRIKGHAASYKDCRSRCQRTCCLSIIAPEPIVSHLADMAIHFQPLTLSLFWIVVFTLTVVGQPLTGKDLEMYNLAQTRYWIASEQSVGFYHRLQWEPDPQQEWRKGAMKRKWFSRAETTGGLHVGSGTDWLGRKVTYFSTFIRPDLNDPLSNQMRLRASLPIDGGQQPKEAAIFWKHVGGSFMPLKVDFLTHFGANYNLESLNALLHHRFEKVHPVV